MKVLSNKIKQKQVSKDLGIELSCLLYYFQKKFYTIESANSKIDLDYVKKLKRHKESKEISKYFLNKGRQVIIEKDVLYVKPVPKFKKSHARIISTPIERDRRKH